MSDLARAYAAGERDPVADLRLTYNRIRSGGVRPVWIALAPEAEALDLLAEATRRLAAGESLPLYGVPFAVKDNIDVADLPTTAACPDFAYRPERSAFAVARLVAAGAIPVGKTNLDQFATGLNGTRSPYGSPACVFDGARVSGGSSSGSAVAVASGLVPFALGTDTAGSGRVPAAFNNIVGLKPTKGLVSTGGVVPACRSQDCVSVFAATVADALAVARIAAGYDPDEPFSRAGPADAWAARPFPAPFCFGVPGPDWLAPLGAEASAAFEAAAAGLEGLGGRRVPIDFAPFAEAGGLLYDGPFVAERLAALRPFASAHPGSLDPSVRAIVGGAGRYGAADLFDGQHRLAELARAAERAWEGADVLLLPTAPLPPTLAAMRADPIGLNAELGRFTTFVNLLDLAAVAVPAGFADGLPFGVTLVGRPFTDGALALLGDRLHRADPAATLGCSGFPLAATAAVEPEPEPEYARVLVGVVGAHLAGQPLNGQLTERGGVLVRAAATAPGYSLYALAGTVPPKPGLVRDGGPGGIELEVWSLPVAGFGSFVAAIPPPLGIGTLDLADGSAVQGFLCESHALAGAADITPYRGWRAYLAARTELKAA